PWPGFFDRGWRVTDGNSNQCLAESEPAGSFPHGIPPKYAVSQVIGFIKGKSAIHLARVYGERKRNFVGQHFWARGYFVSTVGRDTEVMRDYIRKQEEEDMRLEQMNLWR